MAKSPHCFSLDGVKFLPNVRKIGNYHAKRGAEDEESKSISNYNYNADSGYLVRKLHTGGRKYSSSSATGQHPVHPEIEYVYSSSVENSPERKRVYYLSL